MSLFPSDDEARKSLPIFRLVTRYFPKALREVTKVSVANNVRYNPEREPADINWARDKSKDQLGSGFRHMLESEVDGTVFEFITPEVAAKVGFDRVYILAENAWRALAALELAIEVEECKALVKQQHSAQSLQTPTPKWPSPSGLLGGAGSVVSRCGECGAHGGAHFGTCSGVRI